MGLAEVLDHHPVSSQALVAMTLAQPTSRLHLAVHSIPFPGSIQHFPNLPLLSLTFAWSLHSFLFKTCPSNVLAPPATVPSYVLAHRFVACTSLFLCKLFVPLSSLKPYQTQPT